MVRIPGSDRESAVAVLRKIEWAVRSGQHYYVLDNWWGRATVSETDGDKRKQTEAEG